MKTIKYTKCAMIFKFILEIIFILLAYIAVIVMSIETNGELFTATDSPVESNSISISTGGLGVAVTTGTATFSFIDRMKWRGELTNVIVDLAEKGYICNVYGHQFSNDACIFCDRQSTELP